MTVLSLGFLMTSYVRWSGLTEAEVAACRGAGAVTGLLSTVIFPPLQKRIGERGRILAAAQCCTPPVAPAAACPPPLLPLACSVYAPSSRPARLPPSARST